MTIAAPRREVSRLHSIALRSAEESGKAECNVIVVATQLFQTPEWKGGLITLLGDHPCRRSNGVLFPTWSICASITLDSKSKKKISASSQQHKEVAIIVGVIVAVMRQRFHGDGRKVPRRL